MTEGQTDKQTDGQNYDPQDRASIAASRGKNYDCNVGVMYCKLCFDCRFLRRLHNHADFTEFVFITVFVLVTSRICAQICLSSVLYLSVTFVYRTQPVEIFGNVSVPFCSLAIH